LQQSLFNTITLQALDVDVSNVKELFRQLPSPTPNQRAKHDLMISRWEEIWHLCRMYVERLKALENVLKSVDEGFLLFIHPHFNTGYKPQFTILYCFNFN
jgi:hypothetical protein